MATRIKDFDKILPLILALPEGTHFDCMQFYDGKIELQIQAPTQKQKEAIMQAIPVLGEWEGRYDEKLAWWSYTAFTDDIALEIYAVREDPKVPA